MMQCFCYVRPLLQMPWGEDDSRSEHIWPAELGEENGSGVCSVLVLVKSSMGLCPDRGRGGESCFSLWQVAEWLMRSDSRDS